MNGDTGRLAVEQAAHGRTGHEAPGDRFHDAHGLIQSLGVLALARLGARDPQTAAAAVAACFEGVLLHRIARHDDTDPRPLFDLVVKAGLG